jgi:hypothetical protein
VVVRTPVAVAVTLDGKPVRVTRRGADGIVFEVRAGGAYEVRALRPTPIPGPGAGP